MIELAFNRILFFIFYLVSVNYQHVLNLLSVNIHLEAVLHNKKHILALATCGPTYFCFDCVIHQPVKCQFPVDCGLD